MSVGVTSTLGSREQAQGGERTAEAEKAPLPTGQETSRGSGTILFFSKVKIRSSPRKTQAALSVVIQLKRLSTG